MTSIAVVGAGTMGAGIAQVALEAGADRVFLVDAHDAALERARERITSGLTRRRDRGQLATGVLENLDQRLVTFSRLEELGANSGSLEGVVEAVPERLDLKLEVLARIEAQLGSSTWIGSNTSSLPIARLGAALSDPSRLVGIHFFNPVPLMRLVELIPTPRTRPEVLERVRTWVATLGKRGLEVADAPGFLVNRVARPYYLEALRLVGEGIADIPTVDRLLQLGAGFRMGPFALMDLIGVDVNLDVTRSVYEGFSHEPRFRPHPLQIRQVDSGWIGRKVGPGFHPEAPVVSPPVPGQPVRPARLAVLGEGREAAWFATRLTAAGHTIVRDLETVEPGLLEWAVLQLPPAPVEREEAWLTWLDAGLERVNGLVCPGTTLAATEVARELRHLGAGHLGDRVLVTGTQVLDEPTLIEWASAHGARAPWVERTVRMLGSTGAELVEVEDAPGLVLGRMLACLVNEAHLAVQERVSTPADADEGVQLGLNYPRGLVDWGAWLGSPRVMGVLEALGRWHGVERYPIARCLRLEALT